MYKLWSSSTHINAYFASYFENIFAKSIKWNKATIPMSTERYEFESLLSKQTFTLEFCCVPYEHHSTSEAGSLSYPLFHPLQIQYAIESRFLILHFHSKIRVQPPTTIPRERECASLHRIISSPSQSHSQKSPNINSKAPSLASQTKYAIGF